MEGFVNERLAHIPQEQFVAYRKAQDFAFEKSVRRHDPDAWARRLPEHLPEYRRTCLSNSPEPHHCIHCNKAVLDLSQDFQKDVLGENINPKFVVFPCTLQAVRIGAEQGCELFKLVLSQLTQPTDEEERAGDYRLFGNAAVASSGRSGEAAINITSITSLGIIDLNKPWTKWQNQNYQWNRTDAPLGYLEVHCEPDDIAAKYVSNRPISLDPASEMTIMEVKSRLNECLQTGSRNSTPPTRNRPIIRKRLIALLRHDDNWTLKLQDISDGFQYCTLSYCWGGPQPHSTTTHNLGSRYDSLSFEELPRTIQDAVSVAYMLDFQYLWVDSICIVQDDIESKLIDIGNMASIYADSTLTICVSRSLFADEGFIYPRTPYTGTSHSFRMLHRLPSGDIGSIILSEIAAVAKDNRLEERAWGFQERIMSPRILDFDGQATSFTCPHDHAQPAFRDGGPSNHSKDWSHVDNLRITFHRTEQALTDGTIDSSAVLGSPAFQYEWYDIVRAYTERDVTELTDRALAVASIAERLGDITKDEYMAGMWELSMPWSLMWSMRDRDERLPRPVNSPDTYQGPSWSWTGVNGPIHFYFCKELYSQRARHLFGMHGQDVDLVREDTPYGAANSASLVLNGKIRAARWIRTEKSQLSGDYDHLAYIPGQQPSLSSTSEIRTEGKTESELGVLELLPVRMYPVALEEEFAKSVEDGGATELEVVLLQCFVQNDQPLGLVLRETDPGSGFYSRLGIFVSQEGENEFYVQRSQENTRDDASASKAEHHGTGTVDGVEESSIDEIQLALDQAKMVGDNLAQALKQEEEKAFIQARKTVAWQFWKAWFDADGNEVKFLVLI